MSAETTTALREAGNEAYLSHSYLTAHEQWSKAIANDRTDAKAYSNRSMLRLSVFSDVDGAFEDAQAAVHADPLFVRGYERLEAAMRCFHGHGSAHAVYENGMKDTFGKTLQEEEEEVEYGGENEEEEAEDDDEEDDDEEDHDNEEQWKNMAKAKVDVAERTRGSIRAIIALAEDDKGCPLEGASAAQLKDARTLRALQAKIFNNMRHHMSVKMPQVMSWNERIERRKKEKVPEDAQCAPYPKVSRYAERGEATMGLATLPAALLRHVVSFWNYELARAPRGPLDLWEITSGRLPLVALRCLRGSCTALFHAVDRRAYAPLASREFTWEDLARTPDDVMGALTSLNVALASERSFHDPGDDYVDDGDDIGETDNGLLVGCLLAAFYGNAMTVSHVQHLNLDGKLHDTAACAIGAFCPRLRSLDFNYVTVSELGFHHLASGCPLLESFSAGRYAANDAMLFALGESCPLLRLFRCDRCLLVRDAGLKKLAEGCKGLQDLDLTRSSVSSNGVRELLSKCRRLTQLCLNECHDVTEDAFVQLPSLVKSSRGRMRLQLALLEIENTGCDPRAMDALRAACHAATTGPSEKKLRIEGICVPQFSDDDAYHNAMQGS